MDITRDQLLAWAQSPDSARDLPRLVRRLILETATDVNYIDFPGGGGVASGGFDGVVTVGGGDEFVPADLSVWELSVQDGANAKADDDYQKRTSAPEGAATTDCTYVQLIARPWTDHAEWATEKARAGRWRDVRAYNVDMLETWLDRAPATGAWLARRLGLPTAGITTASDWFDSWADATEPTMTPELVLAGRDDQVRQLRGRTSGTPGIVTVGGPLRIEELRAFAAAVLTAPDAPQGSASRSVFVEERDSFERLLSQPTPGLLIITEPAWLNRPTDPHHVVVLAPNTDTGEVNVPPVHRGQVTDSLQRDGVDRRTSEELGELARRSLLALRRRLARQPDLHRPSWAAAGASRLIRRLLLVDRWHEASDGDRAVVARFVGQDYDDLEDTVAGLAADADDPMVAEVDGIWHVVSSKDAWQLLAHQLRRGDLEAFLSLSNEILGERDPRLELDEDDRWLAGFRGLRFRHSNILRGAVAHTLAKLGAYSETVDTGDGRNGQHWADLIVGEVLSAANAEGTPDMWESIAPYLPQLAEASPRVFLESVGAGLAGDQPLLRGIFRDRQDDPLGLGSSSSHTHLLWALERLAWAPEHFGTAVNLLAALAEIDPGGRLQNRPQESLASIFCPWLPHTAATEEQRNAELQRLRRRFPDVTWTLLLSQLPNGHSVQVDQAGADYRDWGREQPTVGRAEHLRSIEYVAAMLVEWVRDEPKRIMDLVEKADGLPPSQRRALRDRLIQLAETDDLTDAQRAEIWERLRARVARHREYADAQWALPEEELRALVQAMETLEPTDPRDRHAWLFSDGLVTMGDLRRRDDHAAYEEALAARRREAIAEVTEHGGLDAVLVFAEQVASAHLVGASLARAAGNRFDEPMLTCLDGEDEHVRTTAFGYVWQRFREQSWEWLDALLEQADGSTPDTVARALLATRDPVGGPERVAEAGDDVQTVFWREFNFLGLGADLDVVDELANKLVDTGRPAAALDFLALYERRRDDSGAEHALLVASAFEALLATPNDPELWRLSGHELSTLFEVLADHRDTVGEDRIIRIEWNLAPALGYDPNLQSIYAAMANSPALFVDMVALQYQPEGDDTEPTDDERRAAENAFRVLKGWKTCPGTDAEGNVDHDRLRAWVDNARAALRDRELVAVGDRTIGEILTHAPQDDDGSWPPAPVRDLIEDLANDDIERGFEIQTFNNRGVTWRDPQGGDPERELAESYKAYAEKARASAPRVAAILDRLAETYDTQARQHDSEAERRRRGLSRSRLLSGQSSRIGCSRSAIA